MANMACVVTHQTYASVNSVRWDWLSDDAAGTATGATTEIVNGQILRVTTIPDGGGLAPDDNYNVTITDADGVDVLMGTGLLRDTANIEHVEPVVTDGNAGNMAPVAVDSILTLNVAAAGNANAGQVLLYYR